MFWCGSVYRVGWYIFFFFKQKTAYEMRISDWSSDVCSSDLQSREGSDQLDRDTGIVDDLHSTLRLSQTLPAARRPRSSDRLTSTVLAPTNLPSWAMDMFSWAIAAPVSSLISMPSTTMATGPPWKDFVYLDRTVVG